MQKQNFFIENPTCRYLLINFFYQLFAEKISKHIFYNKNWEPAETYDFYYKNIFNLNPQKNISLTAYLFVSMNVCKIWLKQQSEEIAQLKKVLENVE